MKGKDTTNYSSKRFSEEIKNQQREEIFWISRKRFEYLSEQVQFGIGLVNRNGEIIYFNHKLINFLNLFNLKIEEVKDLKIWLESIRKESIPENVTFLKLVDDLINHPIQEIRSQFLAIIDKKGIQRYFNFLGIPLGGDNYLLVLKENTESINNEKRIKLLEEKFFHTKKLETIGLLIGEISSNLKDIIEDILEKSELGLTKGTPSTPFFDLFSKIKEAGHNCSDLISKILAFVEFQKMKPDEIDVTSFIQNLSTMVTRILREEIELSLEIDLKSNYIYVDPQVLSLILINIIILFRKIIPTRGTLKIVSKNVFLDEIFCTKNSFIIPGDYIQISLTRIEHRLEGEKGYYLDEGLNINNIENEEVLRDIYSLIKKINGYIILVKDSENRIIVDLYFPIYKPYEIFKKEETITSSKKNVTILLAEDNYELRKIFKSFLEGFGYKVLAAPDGEKALQIFRESVDKIDLAILDLKMPKKDGIEVYRNIKLSRPELPYIFITGDSGERTRHLLDPNSKVFFLKKPFEYEELERKIRELIIS